MNFFSSIGSFFKGAGVIDGITTIATELITTDKESAEAKAVLYSAIDPNGLMRRGISKKVSWLYIQYLQVMFVLFLAQAFGYGNSDEVGDAIDGITSLFLPITAMFTAIVSASFGVNVSNNFKIKKDI